MAGRSERQGISIIQLFDMFPDEQTAREWFESVRWPNGRVCGKCGSVRTSEASHAKMPYWCSDCRSYFSVKTGTVMRSSKVSPPQVGNRHLHYDDFSQGYIQHEAPP